MRYRLILVGFVLALLVIIAVRACGTRPAAADEIRARCPMLPQTTDAPAVAVFVHVVSPTHICALAINGTAEEIIHWSFRLGRGETNRWPRRQPLGTQVPWMMRSLGPGRYTETVLPRAVAPLPPDTYRVCLQYMDGNGEEQPEACSASFTLPPQEGGRKSTDH